jgi:C4-dicarboxylate-specific signal transduction histidine kinase
MRIGSKVRVNSLGNLSVGIGHEIRQPLQSILSQVDAIEVRLEELNVKDQQLDDALQKINDAADRIDATITFIKQLASGDLEDIGTFDMADTIKRECKFVQAQNDDIKFVIHAPNSQPAVTNQTTVMHVLANLLRNSVEAIREAQDERVGQISVSLMRANSRHVLEVADDRRWTTSSTNAPTEDRSSSSVKQRAWRSRESPLVSPRLRR